MSTVNTPYDVPVLDDHAIERDARELLGVACIFGLHKAAANGREQLAIGLLFGMGLLLGLAVAPVIADYAKGDPSALWQAAGATAVFVAACGAYGYATRRDLSSWGRTLFWALLGLIVFGIVAIFVSIPNSHIIYAVAGLGIFGAFTIYDFNRLRRENADSAESSGPRRRWRVLLRSWMHGPDFDCSTGLSYRRARRAGFEPATYRSWR
jgi:FtsH-binding integral membrane protein